MRIAFIVVVGMLVFLALWQGVGAQGQASGPCWTVVHGPIGYQRGSFSNSRRAPETWEAVLVNGCTGETWRRNGYRYAWKPIDR